MMKKMSNKGVISIYVTRDRHTVPNLKGDMGPLPGLEDHSNSKMVKYYIMIQRLVNITIVAKTCMSRTHQGTVRM